MSFLDLTMITRLATLIFLTTAALAMAQNTLPPETADKLDQAVARSLAKFATPGASVAVVHRGRLVYVKAYGLSRVEPPAAAQARTRFQIGSITKQFTAAAILLLREDGKLSLDDRVWKYIPDITRADETTVRQLLSHTAGYQDDWPEDYLTLMLKQPTTPRQVLDVFAKRPLDFEPGTRWQYSNTGFTIAAAIVEKISGKSLFDFLSERIFQPLGMSSVWDINTASLPAEDAVGYTSYALGPPRLAPTAAMGWFAGCGQLAMTAHDLALWDVAMIDQKVLKPASWAVLRKENFLADGKGCRYGLGVFVGTSERGRWVSHNGGMSGYISANMVYPDQGLAIAVLTNSDTTYAPGEIVVSIEKLLEAAATTSPATRRSSGPTAKPMPDAEAQSRQLRAGKMLRDLASGKIDRSLLTDDCNDYFSDEALRDYATTLAPLGEPEAVTETANVLGGDVLYCEDTARFQRQSLTIKTRTWPDGKFQEYMVVRPPG